MAVMTGLDERWTTLLALICSMISFLGHLGMSQELPELPEVPEEDAPPEVWEEFLRKVDEFIIAEQQKLANEQKRSDPPDNYDRFAEAEKSPHHKL
ncbi:UNVERIFIED_CONTAM: hypothetical protein K2H54_023738 [Gekko kuhli]